MIRTTHKEFVRLLSIHNPSLTVLGKYKNNNTKIRVIDKEGIVYNKIPKSLLSSKTTRLFLAENKTKAFKLKLKKILPTIKVVSDYIKGNIKIKVKDELGIEYSVKPESLLLGRKPIVITALDKNKAFSIKANKIHKGRYDYSLVNYIGNKKKVKIICKNHGVFEQKPNTHLNGMGCIACHLECSTGWSKGEWIRYTKKSKECVFYIIECFNDTERFIKVGITKKSINKRYSNKREMPYNYKILWQEKGSGLFVWKKEKSFLKENREYKYLPRKKFKGIRECFNMKIINKIKKQKI